MTAENNTPDHVEKMYALLGTSCYRNEAISIIPSQSSLNFSNSSECEIPLKSVLNTLATFKATITISSQHRNIPLWLHYENNL